MIKELLKNKLIVYLFSRYGTYALQFVVSLIIANKLGPIYMGVYGLVQLLINYIGQFHLGISHSLNVLMVHNKNDKHLCDEYVANSLILYFILSIFIIIFYLFYIISGVHFATEYNIDSYLLPICLIAIFQYFKGVSYTVLRVRNMVHQLTIIQSSEVVLYFFSTLFFDGKELITALVFSQLLSYSSSLLIAYWSNVLPSFHSFNYRVNIQRAILTKGFFLFLYNVSFYFILISIRTLVSANYSVSEFGMFTFAFNIAHAVLLLLDSLSIVVFPKIIDLLSSDDSKVIKKTIDTLRITYISTSHLLIYIALLFYPLLVLIMPKYEDSLTSMNLIALAVLTNTNSFGYSTFLIAQNKERLAAKFSIYALVLNILLGVLLVYTFHVSFSYVILATLFTYLFFSFVVVTSGKKILGSLNWCSTFKDFFPLRLLIPFSTALVLSIFRIQYLIWVPLICYLLLNFNDLFELKRIARKLIYNPNVTDV